MRHLETSKYITQDAREKFYNVLGLSLKPQTFLGCFELYLIFLHSKQKLEYIYQNVLNTDACG